MNISSLDLNLLYIFFAIRKHGSVSLAATSLGLSQPAVSHGLKRLRLALKDELFIRSPRGMIPTTKALGIENQIEDLFINLQGILNNTEVYDAQSSTNLFTLCCTDHEILFYLASLVSDQAKISPRAQFRFLNPNQNDFFGNLISRNVDLAFGVDIPRREEFVYDDIYSQSYVCLTRKNMNIKNMNMKTYVGLDHILVAPLGGVSGPIDLALEKRSLKRNVAVSVPSFSLIPSFLLSRDFVVTVPEALGLEMMKEYKLDLHKLPLKIEKVKMTMVWHKSRENDLSHLWLRNEVRKNLSSKLETIYKG